MKLRAMVLLTVIASVPAFAEKDIKPGAPAGSCCRVDGREGSSRQRTLDGVQVWTCVLDTKAFQSAWDAGLLPYAEFEGQYSAPLYPTCPSGWRLTANAGADTCIAPTPPTPQCPEGQELTRDEYGTEDTCAQNGKVGPVGTWTEWFNRDNQGGAGDYELLKDLVDSKKVCAGPLVIECQTVKDGTDWSKASLVYHCDLSKGGYCVNREQAAGKPCQDFKVRYLCS